MSTAHIMTMTTNSSMRMCEIYIWRRLWVVALGFDKSGLEMDDVFAKGVVFGLDGLEVVLEGVEVADLLFEFLDIAFLPLTERPLYTQ